MESYVLLLNKQLFFVIYFCFIFGKMHFTFLAIF